jgi:hypothetical protein
MRWTRIVSVIRGTGIVTGRADVVVGIVDSRLRTRGKKSAFQQSLETLKRMLPFVVRTLILTGMQVRGVACP